MKKPQPNKAHRVAAWFLVYRVAVNDTLTEAHQRIVCERVKLTWEAWQAAKAQFPQLMARVEEKRARRRLWQEHFGPPPDGWTPPDPGRAASENFPATALACWRSTNAGTLLGGRFGEWLTREYLKDEACSQEWRASQEKQDGYARACDAGAMQRGKTPG